MTDRLRKLILDNPERFKGVLEDLIIAYEGYIDDLRYGSGITNAEEQIKEVKSDIEYVKELRQSVL